MESESEPLLQNTSVETDFQNALFAIRKIVQVHIAKILRCVNFQFHGHCNMPQALLNILKADLPT